MPADSPSSTTTQILFNSPALHALKRDQLVKLCKIHSIKANGKTTELIEKLKGYGQSLSVEPLHLGNGQAEEAEKTEVDNTVHDIQVPLNDREDEEDSESASRFQMPRPSEQWEVAMESIEESEEGTGSSQGTLNSTRSLATLGNITGEFGSTGGLSRSMSSLKALATSLGLKRETSNSSGVKHAKSNSKSGTSMDNDLKSVPYSETLPCEPPQSDGFTFDTSPGRTNNPIPGAPALPGMPVPANARLSMSAFPSGMTEERSEASSSASSSAQPTTTIRLISSSSQPTPQGTSWSSRHSGMPELKPFHTTFELDIGSPSTTKMWPANDAALYPTLTASLSGSSTMNVDSQSDDEIMPGGLNSWKPVVTTPWGETPVKRDPPAIIIGDVFSPAPLRPLPILATTPLTSRVASTSTPNPNVFVFGSPHPQKNSLSNAEFRTAAQTVLDEMNARLASAGVSSVSTDVLDLARRAALAAESANFVPLMPTQPDRYNKVHKDVFDRMEGIDSWAGKRSPDRALLRKRKSSAITDDGPRARTATKMRVSCAKERMSAGRGVRPRASILSGGSRVASGSSFPESEERGKKRARVEHSGDKLSSPGIAKESISAEEEAAAVETAAEAERKQKEREAIRRKLDANKARRRSSMGVNVVAVKPKPKPSRFGFLSSAKSLVRGVWGRAAGTSTSKTTIPAPSVIPKPTVPSVSKSNKVPVTRKPSMSGSSTSRISLLKSSAPPVSTPSRPPIPAGFHGSSSSKHGNSKSSMGVGSTSSSRVSSVATRTSTHSPAFSSGSRVSSIGTRSSATSASSTRVSSMGSKSALALTGVSEECNTTNSSIRAGAGSTGRKTGSRLLAPTASSLAKARHSSIVNANNSAALTAAALAGLKEPSPAFRSNPVTTRNPFNLDSPNKLLKSPPSRSPGTIFSKPLTAPSGSSIPIPSPTRAAANTSTSTEEMLTAGLKPRSIGRKPRISRSKVIAKLASQRAAASSGTSRPSMKNGKTRSSLGAATSNAKRSSVGGARVSNAEGIMMSAKKRARQSEFARRRSRAAGSSTGMNVDP